MAENIEVRSVVCDYGVFIDDELKIICNSRSNALLIKAILDKDNSYSMREGNSDYVFTLDDARRFLTESRGGR